MLISKKIKGKSNNMKNICNTRSDSSILTLLTAWERNEALEPYNININATDVQIVGKLNIESIKRLTGINFPVAEVQIHPGAIRHIKREHPGIIEQYGHLIPEMISHPDYVGKNPTVPNSVELIKVVTDTVLLAIKLDPTGYLYISSFYDLNNAAVKLQKRLRSKRLVPYVE